MTDAIRIAVLTFVHETVTFLPNDTTLDDFVYDGSPARGEALLAWEPRSYVGGFVKLAREHAGVELVGIESPLWPRTGTGSGWITTEAYEHFLGRMLAELEGVAAHDLAHAVSDVGDGPRDDQRQAGACAHGPGGRREPGGAPARGAAEHDDGASRPPRRDARQRGGGARRVARGAGRPFRPLGFGDVGA